MFTSTHGRAIGGDPLSPTANSGGRTIGDATFAFMYLKLNSISRMTFTPLDREAPRGLGYSPRSWSNRIQAVDVLSAASAIGDRGARYRSAGMGRGGHAP
jgi:hypothetical protein